MRSCPLPALHSNPPQAAAAGPDPWRLLPLLLLLLRPCAVHCAGLHSLPVELVEDIALKKAQAESMRLEFNEAVPNRRGGGSSQHQVVLERAMNSPVVTVTRRWRDSRISGWPSKPGEDAACGHERTVHARARLPLVLDVLLLALHAEYMMGGENPHCTVSFQMGGEPWGEVQLTVPEFDYEGVNAANDDEVDAAYVAWELAKHEVALAHPTVARMLRVLCDNSAL